MDTTVRQVAGFATVVVRLSGYARPGGGHTTLLRARRRKLVAPAKSDALAEAISNGEAPKTNCYRNCVRALVRKVSTA